MYQTNIIAAGVGNSERGPVALGGGRHVSLSDARSSMTAEAAAVYRFRQIAQMRRNPDKPGLPGNPQDWWPTLPVEAESPDVTNAQLEGRAP